MTAVRRLALLAGAVTLLAACAPPPAQTGSLPVVASFYPLFAFAARVGSETAAVRNLLPAGVEPHDFEPTAQDLAALVRAALFIYNGGQLEPWVDGVRRQLGGGTTVVNATAGIILAMRGGRPDPHVWLDPVLAGRQVENVLAGFGRADPAHRKAYAARAAALQEDLRALDARFADTLARCRRRTFVSTHGAFGYLARRYGLVMVPISGLAPEAEPPPGALKEVVRLARKDNVRVVFTEPLTSPRVAEVVAREIGARTAVLHPVEGLTRREQQAGKNYFTVMHENLARLAEGLDCR